MEGHSQDDERGGDAVKPCDCCKHEDDEGDIECLTCVYDALDHFAPVDGCVGCKYDPRKDCVCNQCVDHDMYEPNDSGQPPLAGKETT